MSTPVAMPRPRLPRQVPYIIGNEACERFSFYGMRNILVQFLVSSVILAYLPEAERDATAIRMPGMPKATLGPKSRRKIGISSEAKKLPKLMVQ